MQQKILNTFTIDLEDWLQSTLDHSLPISERVINNTHRVLAVLEHKGVKATFFVLGLVAEKYPALVREIADQGHEIQSHGYAHKEIFDQTPEEFAEDLRLSKTLLEDITGKPVLGFRAPDFSILSSNLWALETLAKAGFRYDSSIFPLDRGRYGIVGWPRFPTKVHGDDLLEAPVATAKLAGRIVPVGGGGYFRLWPYMILKKGIQEINKAGYPAIIYMHPYEFAPDEITDILHSGIDIPHRLRLSQGIGRRGVRCKVEKMFDDFEFGTMQDAIAPWLR